MWPRCVESPDVVCKMGGPGAWGCPSEAELLSYPMKVMPKIPLTLFGVGIFLCKRW